MGATTPGRTEIAEIRRYLLGQLTEEEEERVELRLLTDPAYVEEFDIMVDEITDQYVRSELRESERDQARRYFFRSTERQEKLRFAIALARHKKTPRRQPWWKGHLPLAASLLIAACAGLGAWWLFFHQSEVDKGLAALNAAYRDQRPVEARITALKSYAPFSQTRGPGTEIGNQDELHLAELTLTYALKKRPTPPIHHALGEVYLAQTRFDAAIAEFEEAIKGDPNNPQLLSDLGAAWLEKGKREREGTGSGKSVEAFARSLGNLSKALELDPNLLEALFDRALCRQYMTLWHEATNDWQEYIRRDPNSQWANEARQNLKLLQERTRNTSQNKDKILQSFLNHAQSLDDETGWRLISSYHEREGNVIVEQLLDGYLAATTDDQQDTARQKLQLLSDVGNLERQRVGEKFFWDMVQFYRTTTPKQRAMLIEARSLMKSAHLGWGQSGVDDSLRSFRQAKDLFDRAGDVCESIFADYWLSFCYYRQHNEKLSLSLLRPLISACESASYKYPLVRSLYLLSALHFNLNEHSKAIEFARRSLTQAEQTNDIVGMLNAITSLIEYFRYLGNYAESLGYLQKSLLLASSISLDPIQGIRHYGFAATAFASSGYYAAAAEYEREALGLALSTGNVSTISYSYAFLAIVNSKLQNYKEALQNAKRAYEVAEAHSNEPPDRELMAYASLQMGNIHRQAGNFDLATTSYSRSIQAYESLDQPTNLYQAHKGRFLSYVAQKNDVLAKAELATTLKLAEGYRDKILEETVRETYFDAEQNLYDVGMDFEYSRSNDPRESFQLSESSHARSLLDLIHSDSEVLTKSREPEIIPRSVSLPLSTDEVLNQLPEQTQVIQYGVLENKLLIWVVSKGKIVAFARNIGQKELSDKVLGYLKLAASPSESGSEALQMRAKDLFDILIRPVQSMLDPSKQICVVPDKVLSYIPFVALVSSSSGKYLIEEYRLIVSPSSTVFILCSQIARKKKGMKEDKLLSVGNPQFDHQAFPSFSDLPEAAQEVTEVSSFYGSPRTLIGEQAQVDLVKSEMSKSDVVHLAVHSALDERFPLRSKLLLARNAAAGAGSQSGASVLYAYEIYGLKLPRTRLAVLSACATGAEQYYGGEGMISMARPFIAARVPLVVASLWPVDSESTRELMVNFQKRRKVEGFSTVEALRDAQITMLHSTDERYRRPYFWAPFVVIGGYAEF